MRSKTWLFPPAITVLLFAMWPTASSIWFILFSGSLVAAFVLYRHEKKSLPTVSEIQQGDGEKTKKTPGLPDKTSTSSVDDVIDKPSLAAGIFMIFYLIPMGVYRNRAALMWLIAMIIAPFIWFMLIIFPWSYFVLKGRKLAWETRKWRDIEEFQLCQRKWDLWAKGAVAVFMGIMIVTPFI